MLDIIQKIQSLKKYKEEYIYLLEKISDDAGFFFHDNKIMYMHKSYDTLSKNFNTQLLSIKTNIFVSSVEEQPQFQASEYNILFYNANITDNNQMFDTFQRMCRVYAIASDKVDFLEFFDNLISLFKIASEKQFKNIIGLYGELSFLKDMFEKNQLNLSKNWQKESDTDKYDIVLDSINLELKTTMSQELTFLIKHQQVFNDKNNCLVITNISKDPSGESIDELIKYFRKNDSFISDFKFQTKLQEVSLKIENSEKRKERFSVSNRKFYLTRELVTFNFVPENISSLEYRYNFVGQKNTPQTEVVKLLKLEKK